MILQIKITNQVPIFQETGRVSRYSRKESDHADSPSEMDKQKRFKNLLKTLLKMSTLQSKQINEESFQKHLEIILHGGHVNYGFYGISDITNDAFHAEIKSWQSWKNVIGQLTSYNHASPRSELRAYMYGNLPSKPKLQLAMSLLAEFNINAFHIEMCQNVLTITDLEDMSICEYTIDSFDEEEIDVEKMKQEIKYIYEQSLKCEDKFCINLDDVAKLLKCHKNNVIRTLKSSYHLDVDYIMKRAKKPVATRYGGNNYNEVLLSPDCFKRLCLLSRTKTLKNFKLLM